MWNTDLTPMKTTKQRLLRPEVSESPWVVAFIMGRGYVSEYESSRNAMSGLKR